MTPTRPTLLLATTLLLASAGCTIEAGDCVKTTTRARTSGRVDVSAPGRSGQLAADLKVTEGGTPIGGATIGFVVTDNGSSVYDGQAVTGADGVARLDLKRADPQALLALLRADAYTASFGGDGTHCASSGSARVQLVR